MNSLSRIRCRSAIFLMTLSICACGADEQNSSWELDAGGIPDNEQFEEMDGCCTDGDTSSGDASDETSAPDACSDIPQVDEERLLSSCTEGETACVRGTVHRCSGTRWRETSASCCGLQIADINAGLRMEAGGYVSVESGDASPEACTAQGSASYSFVAVVSNDGNRAAEVRCQIGRAWPVAETGPFRPSQADDLSTRKRDLDLNGAATDGVTVVVEPGELISASPNPSLSFTSQLCPSAAWLECQVVADDAHAVEPSPYVDECVMWRAGDENDSYVPPVVTCMANKVWRPGVWSH